MQWLSIGFKLLPLIVRAISWVEKFARGKGKEKQDAAVEMIRSMLELAEEGTQRDLVYDAEVDGAVRKAIDAIVAVQNLLVRKVAPAPTT